MFIKFLLEITYLLSIMKKVWIFSNTYELYKNPNATYKFFLPHFEQHFLTFLRESYKNAHPTGIQLTELINKCRS